MQPITSHVIADYVSFQTINRLSWYILLFQVSESQLTNYLRLILARVRATLHNVSNLLANEDARRVRQRVWPLCLIRGLANCHTDKHKWLTQAWGELLSVGCDLWDPQYLFCCYSSSLEAPKQPAAATMGHEQEMIITQSKSAIWKHVTQKTFESRDQVHYFKFLEINRKGHRQIGCARFACLSVETFL